jgi:hypothetical protein
MSVYLEQYDNSAEEDQGNYCRQLEQKLHYVLSMLQQAGLMLDADGNVIKSLPDSITDDCAEVQSSIKENW